MNPGLIVVVIVVFVLAWVGFGLYVGVGEAGSGSGQQDPDPSEWPVVARSTNEQEIYLLESTLESKGIDVIAETENPNSVEGAVTALRNQIRVPPTMEKEARRRIQESGNEALIVN